MGGVHDLTRVLAAAQPEAGGQELQELVQLIVREIGTFLSTYKLPLIFLGVVLVVLAGIVVVRSSSRDLDEMDEEVRGRPKGKTQKTQLLHVSETFTALARMLGKEDAPPGVPEAMDELGQGRPQAAERVFEEVLRRAEASSLTAEQSLEESTVLAANKAGAEAARHLGDLASLYDLDKAIQKYRRATIMDRSDPAICNRLGIALLEHGSLKEAELTHRRALDLAEQLSLLPEKAESHRHLGTVHLARHQLERARAELDQALSMEEQRGHRPGIAACHRQLARLFELEGDLGTAEERLDKALEIYRRDGDREGQAAVRNHLGMLFWRQGRLDEAEKMVARALSISEERQRRARVAAAHGNLGLIHEKRGQHARAEESLQKALGIYNELGHRRGMGLATANLAVLQQEMGDDASAERWHKRALEIVEGLNNQGDLACELYHLARLQMKRGQLDEAERALQKAAHLDQELGQAEDLGLDHRALVEVYDALGEEGMAHDMQALIPPDLPPRRPGERRRTF